MEGSDSKFGLWDNGKSEDVRLVYLERCKA
jgi:hypothetical protein